MRKLATIRSISEIVPIKGADRIVAAHIDGWQVVIRKDEFQVGDKVVYFEIDSVLPETEWSEFMRDRKFRVKTIKLRNTLSQGLALPLSILPDGDYEVGDDVTEVLGVAKYDPQAQEEQKLKVSQKKKQNGFVNFMNRFAWFRKLTGKTKRGRQGFPDFIVKTDEERLQNLPVAFEDWKTHGITFSCTEKIDGQSGTYFLRRIKKNKYEFGVCSRNVRLFKEDNSSYWSIARKFKIDYVLRDIIGDHDLVVLQGEIIGPGIQGNKYCALSYDFYAFNLIFDGVKVTTEECEKELKRFGIDTVPIIYRDMELSDDIMQTVDISKGKSVLNYKINREGLVWRNYKHGISFKCINPDFLLKEEE